MDRVRVGIAGFDTGGRATAEIYFRRTPTSSRRVVEFDLRSQPCATVRRENRGYSRRCPGDSGFVMNSKELIRISNMAGLKTVFTPRILCSD
jgi:hypothetical protein